jgi:alkyl hydroperoxide reductase subunit F
VFLEIGLSPNTDPVAGIAPLDERGEVQVKPDRSTTVPGFFAAGDVADVAEKQISVAVGDGTLAALTAYKYLLDRNLVVRASTADDWA